MAELDLRPPIRVLELLRIDAAIEEGGAGVCTILLLRNQVVVEAHDTAYTGANVIDCRVGKARIYLTKGHETVGGNLSLRESQSIVIELESLLEIEGAGLISRKGELLVTTQERHGEQRGFVHMVICPLQLASRLATEKNETHARSWPRSWRPFGLVCTACGASRGSFPFSRTILHHRFCGYE
ncbi:MAG: hypothetical protein ACI97A_003107 [Planctomycetota bacterium]|jgi:hypothetical protein